MGQHSQNPPMHEAQPQTLAGLIVAQAASCGDAIAVDDGEIRLTYAELVARARALGSALAPYPEPIGILLPIGTDYLVAIVAALLADKIFVPMDMGFPEKRNLRIAAQAGMAAVVVDETSAALIDPSVQRIPVTAAGDAGALGEVPVRSDRILTIFYTSGSTGEPKGVCHSEAGLLHDLRHFIESHGLGADDVHSLLFSPSVSIANRDIYATLIVGARLAIIDFRRIGIGPALQEMARQGVSMFHSVPSAFRALFGSGHPDAAAAAQGIRFVRINGDRALKRDVEIYRRVFARDRRLSLDIGTTETRPYAAWMVDHDTPLPRPIVPVGYPRADLDIALLDDDGAVVPEGEIGEIVIAGKGLSAGYWRDPALTAERFFPSARLPGMTEYRSGDFGRMLPGGLLEIVGRRDRQIKVRGNTVHLGEIEAALGDCPGIGDVAAIGRGQGDETRVIVYCTAGEGMGEAIRAWARAELPPAHRPAEVIVAEALPMLGPGKIDLVELERIDGARVRADTNVAAVETEDAISQAWAALLGADALLTDATFEEAGGDSIQAMMLVLDLERRLERHLPNGLIEWKTRPGELVARIAALGAQERRVSADRPTVFFFPGAFGADFASNAFMRLLGDAFQTVLLDYRASGAELLGPVDREEVFRAIDTHIARGVPERLWMVGYSMGARIAAEAARRLIERGISVEYVVLIDGPSDSLIAERVAKGKGGAPRPPMAKRVAAAGGWFGFATARVASSVSHRMVTASQFARLHAVVAALPRWRLKAAADEMVRVALSRTRVKAFKNILAAPLPMPATLFVSSAAYSKSRTSPDLGWGPWCGALDVIELEGDHHDIIEGAQAGRIVAVLRDAEARLRTTRAE